jgi:NhaP-type Na+/H+ or K+/H+ antiporter
LWISFFFKEFYIVHWQYSTVNYSQSQKIILFFGKFSLLVLVGIGFGALINYMEPRVFPEFGPELFFHWLLPPIILEAAYSLYHRAFLQNIGTILLFAVVVSICSIVQLMQ